MHDCTKILYHNKTEKQTYHGKIAMLSGFDCCNVLLEICFVSNRTEHQEANTNCNLWTVPVKGGEVKCLTAENEAWDGTPVRLSNNDRPKPLPSGGKATPGAARGVNGQWVLSAGGQQDCALAAG